MHKAAPFLRADRESSASVRGAIQLLTSRSDTLNWEIDVRGASETCHMERDLACRLSGSPPEPVESRKRWRYEGIGWPRSRTEVRLWIPVVAVVVALTVWGYVAIGPNGRIEPGRTELHKTDFTVFTEAGAAFFDGRDPYRVANPRGWHYLYPPLFALLVAPLSAFDSESQVVIWFALNAVMAFGCLGEARRLWRLVCGAESARFLWVAGCAFLAVFVPFLDCMQSGQLGIAILYLLMLGMRIFLQYRSRISWFLAGLILALPAVIKLVPALPVLFLVFLRWLAVAKPHSRPRPWAQAATLTAGTLTGAMLFLLLIPASVIGWRANLEYLNRWHGRVVTNERVGANANFNIHSYRNQSLANAVYLLQKTSREGFWPNIHGKAAPDRPERVVHSSVRLVVAVILAVLIAAGGALGRRTENLDQAVAYGLAACATLVVSPLSWGHYYMIELLAVLFVPIWFLRRGKPRLARVVAVIPPVLSWSHYVAMPYTCVVGLLGLGTTAWFLGVCGLILLSGTAPAAGAAAPHFAGRRRRRTRFSRPDRAGSAIHLRTSAQDGDRSTLPPLTASEDQR
jgi:hypothetical protein